MTGLDGEVRAMQAMLCALNAVPTYAGRVRVVRYLIARFDLPFVYHSDPPSPLGQLLRTERVRTDLPVGQKVNP